MAKQQSRSSGGNRKKDRNRDWCERYRKEGRREKNKLRKMKHHLNKHPNDKQSQDYANKLQGV